MPKTLSDVFLNMHAEPRELNTALLVRGSVFFSRASVAVTAADGAGHIYPMFRVPAHGRLLALWVGNDQMTGNTDFDFGIYTAVNWSVGDGAIKDQNIYADGITMGSARSVNVDAAQSGVPTAATNSMFNVLGRSMAGSTAITGIQWARRVWEDAGDATEPRAGTEYDLCWTAVVNPVDPGTIVTGILFVLGA